MCEPEGESRFFPLSRRENKIGGAVAGDMLSGATRVQRLARQNGCEDYVDKLSGGRQVGRASVPAVDAGYPTYSAPYSRSRGFYDNPGPFSPYR